MDGGRCDVLCYARHIRYIEQHTYEHIHTLHSKAACYRLNYVFGTFTAHRNEPHTEPPRRSSFPKRTHIICHARILFWYFLMCEQRGKNQISCGRLQLRRSGWPLICTCSCVACVMCNACYYASLQWRCLLCIAVNISCFGNV